MCFQFFSSSECPAEYENFSNIVFLPWVTLVAHESCFLIVFTIPDQEQYTTFIFEFIAEDFLLSESSVVNKVDEFPRFAKIDYLLRYILSKIYDYNLFVFRRVMLVGNEGILRNPLLV